MMQAKDFGAALARISSNPKQHRKAPSELPPLRKLPPPITHASPPAPDVDMDVDFKTEVEPHLGECLVSMRAAVTGV